MSHIHRVRLLQTTPQSSRNWVLSLWERPRCLLLRLQKSQLINGSTTTAPSTQGVMCIRLLRVVLLALVLHLQDIPGSTLQSGVIIKEFSSVLLKPFCSPSRSIRQCTSSCRLQRPFRPQDYISHSIASRQGIIPSCKYICLIYSLNHAGPDYLEVSSTQLERCTEAFRMPGTSSPQPWMSLIRLR